MQSRLYREESLSQITKPHQLNDYIKVSSPGIWIVIAAILVFLVGLIVWATLGQITVSTETIAVVKNKRITVYFDVGIKEEIYEGMTVYCGDETFSLPEVDYKPVSLYSENLSDYARYEGGFTEDSRLIRAIGDTDLSDGVYFVSVNLNSDKPIRLIID